MKKKMAKNEEKKLKKMKTNEQEMMLVCHTESINFNMIH